MLLFSAECVCSVVGRGEGNITSQGDWSPGFGVLGPRYWHQFFGLKPTEA